MTESGVSTMLIELGGRSCGVAYCSKTDLVAIAVEGGEVSVEAKYLLDCVDGCAFDGDGVSLVLDSEDVERLLVAVARHARQWTRRPTWKFEEPKKKKASKPRKRRSE